MSDATTSNEVSPGLLMVAERARRDPNERILALCRFIDEGALARSHRRLRKDAAVGVDGVTVEQYGQHLEGNLVALHARMKTGQYRHQPIRRVHIPKDNGKTRPIGVSTVEDKIVQGAVREVLEAVYEQEFLSCSHGFRPKRKAHDAIRVLASEVDKGWVRFIVEADIVSFFDRIDRSKLMTMLRKRIADESLMRLVGKCLHVGVLDGAEYSEPDEGTAQGSVLSPLLGNIYLHNVLDLWIERDVKPRLRGRCALVRYADDLAIAFERQDDAERVLEVLPKRMEKYGLALHPERRASLLSNRRVAARERGARPSTSWVSRCVAVHRRQELLKMAVKDLMSVKSQEREQLPRRLQPRENLFLSRRRLHLWFPSLNCHRHLRVVPTGSGSVSRDRVDPHQVSHGSLVAPPASADALNVARRRHGLAGGSGHSRYCRHRDLSPYLAAASPAQATTA